MEEKNNENTENFGSFFDEKPSDEVIDSSLFDGEEVSENLASELGLDEGNIQDPVQEVADASFFADESQTLSEVKEENLEDFSIPQEQQEEFGGNFDNLDNNEIDKSFLGEDVSNSAFESSELEENLDFSQAEEISESSQTIVEPVQKKSFVEDIDENYQEPAENSDLITVRPVKFKSFNDNIQNRAIKKNLDIMQDISLQISVELGRTKSSIREVMELEKGSIVELDKIAGEQVEVFVNGKLVAKGEVIVIEDKFGVRVISTNISQKEENI